MSELARDRAAGAHPYFTPVAHTARARDALGLNLFAPEVAVVVERDRTTRGNWHGRFMSGYLMLPNYTNNLRALGFTEDDLAGGGSDRLVDAIVGWEASRPSQVASGNTTRREPIMCASR